MLSVLLGLLIALLIIGFWYNSMQAHEKALEHAQLLCEQDRVQLLDDTVTLKKTRFMRQKNGKLSFKRTYTFDYTRSGQDRYTGSLTLLGGEVLVSQLDLAAPHPHRSTETFKTSKVVSFDDYKKKKLE